MRRLWTYLARYRARYVAGCICLVITASLAMAIPFLLKHAVDSIPTGDGVAAADVAAGAHRAGLYALGVIVIAIFQGVARTFSRFVIFNVGRRRVRPAHDLFRHLDTPWQFYQTRSTGDLMSRLVNDISAGACCSAPACSTCSTRRFTTSTRCRSWSRSTRCSRSPRSRRTRSCCWW
jgi:ATP-binding cassette subfamily B protein